MESETLDGAAVTEVLPIANWSDITVTDSYGRTLVWAVGT